MSIKSGTLLIGINETAKFLKHEYQYPMLVKQFSRFYFKVISKYSHVLNTSSTEKSVGTRCSDVYGDVVFKFRRIVGKADCFGTIQNILIFRNNVQVLSLAIKRQVTRGYSAVNCMRVFLPRND